MPLSTYLFVLFGVSIIFYLMGYQPAMFITFSQSFTSNSAQALINNIYNIFTNPLLLSALGISAVTSYLLGGGNFSIFYIFPLILLVLFANLFILPTSYLFDNTLPFLLRMFISVFFNLFLMLSIVEFIKGGSV